MKKHKKNKTFVPLHNLIGQHKKIILFSLALSFFFFGRLFFPNRNIFYTPDFGRSDIWHQNYPFKEILSQSLKSFTLPLWNKDLGMGFPLLAEGQIGIFFAYNLIAYFLLPTYLAWNLSYPLTFTLMLLGVYFFARTHKISKKASCLAAITFTFSSYHILQVPHLNLIQAISLFPWLMFLAAKIIKKPKVIDLGLSSIILSQQIFLAYYQITLISLFGVLLFSLLYLHHHKKLNLKKISALIFAVILGFCLASVQLLPSLELMQNSPASSGSSEIFRFPLPLKHLITYIFPNYFGSSKLGTYPAFDENWGLYWENTHYLGIIPLLLILFRFIFLRKKSLDTFEKIFLIFIPIFTIFALGKNTPLSFLFSYFPLNLFRVPARFLILTTFSLSVLAGFSFDKIITTLKAKLSLSNLNLLIFITILLSTFDLFYFGFFYHPTVKLSDALAPPEIVSHLPKKSRYYSYPDQYTNWNQTFTTSGWQNIEPYLYFKNALSPDQNTLWDLPSLTVYSGLRPKRLQVLENYYFSDAMVNLYGAQYIISPAPKPQSHYKLINTIKSQQEDLKPFYLYQNLMSLPRFRFAHNIISSKSIEESAQIILTTKQVGWTGSVVLESSFTNKLLPLSKSEIKIVKDSNNHLILKTSSDQDSILVVADSFYPGWEASIDGVKTDILPANLNNRGIVVAKGDHLIEMKYYPKYFYAGAVISTISHLFVFLLFYLNFQKNLQIYLK